MVSTSTTVCERIVTGASRNTRRHYPVEDKPLNFPLYCRAPRQCCKTGRTCDRARQCAKQQPFWTYGGQGTSET